MELLERVRQANMAKSEFLSRMSHDLRTPINGIIGMLEIAKKNRTNPDKIDECLNKIAVSCDHLISLVTDVLDMNTLENNQFLLTDESFCLEELLTKELYPTCKRASERGLTYRTQLEPFTHPNIIGSPKHVLQIFNHVLDNAIKYNKPNGSITLTARETSDNDNVAIFEFQISDTGIGMKPEFAKRVFEAFEQEHNEARTDYMGTGLGMSIVKTLVTHMNGTISLESIPGEGTTVLITLPFKIDPTPAGRSASSPDNGTAASTDSVRGDLSGRVALLVEDNEINMEITRFLLEDADIRVVCAENGQQALTLYGESAPNEFDFILMDIMMPVMDGLEAAQKIRQLPRPDAMTVPIIALSANVMDNDIKKTKMAGMNEHLPKPVNSHQLLDTIAKCLHL